MSQSRSRLMLSQTLILAIFWTQFLAPLEGRADVWTCLRNLNNIYKDRTAGIAEIDGIHMRALERLKAGTAAAGTVLADVTASSSKVVADYLGRQNRFVRAAAHVVPVLPLARSLSDRDKLFLLFVEGPMMGLITDPLATALARGATGQQMFGPQMVTDFLQSMGAYRVSTIVRSGVTIDDKMGGFVIPFIKKGVSPDEIKIMINWAYSFAIYATFTAGGIMESADTDDERAFAWALIAFAGLWPILTQRLQTKYFVPFLFDKFPKQSLLKKLKDPAAHKAIQMVRGEESEILKVLAQQGVEKPGEKLYDYAPKAGRVGEGQVYRLTQKQINKVGHHQSNIRWINFVREGEEQGNPNLTKKRFAMWGIKFGAYAGIAATMITAYFMVRYSTVGKTEKIDGQTVITDIGPLTRMMKAIAAWSKTADPNSPQAMASPDDITEDDVRGMVLTIGQILEEERS